MKFVEDDGGRKAAGFKGTTGDCVCRAIAIASGRPYQEVYDALSSTGRHERRTGRKRSHPRTGMHKRTSRAFLIATGWKWTPTMQIGQGTKVHLRDGELPSGRLIVQLSKHLTAVIDGVIHDLYDPSRDGTRCVYGYFSSVVTRPSSGAVGRRPRVPRSAKSDTFGAKRSASRRNTRRRPPNG